jgi:hypothetical protein
MPLPKGVHTKHGRYYLVRSNRWIPLSLVEAGPAALRTALGAVPPTDDQLPPRNVGELLERFLASGLDELSLPTQHGYRVAISSQLIPSFGSAPIDSVEPGDVSVFLERRRREGRAVSGNRERAALGPSLARISGPFIRRGFPV